MLAFFLNTGTDIKVLKKKSEEILEIEYISCMSKVIFSTKIINDLSSI